LDTIANIVKRLTGNTVGNLASKLLVSAGKNMASETGERLASRFIEPSLITVFTPPPSLALPQPTVTGLTPQNASIPQLSTANHQGKLNEIMSKYTGSGGVQQSAITIQDLVRKMHQDSGLKVI
jgi:hypothetical protein